MNNRTANEMSIYCNSEYGTLEDVILCTPRFMKIREIINETQKYYVSENIDTEIACSEHKKLIDELHKHHIHTHLLEAEGKFPEQVFTRDIGFVIDHTLFIASMKQDIRKGEIEPLKKWADEHQLQFAELKHGFIEGGDVIVDRDHIWIGKSDRTTLESINELRQYVKQKEIHVIEFDESYLHLDCVFQPISNKEALVFPPAISEKSLHQIEQYFRLIKVSEQEQFTLGTNVLSIGDKKVFSLPINKHVNQQLRQLGFEVIEIDISEIIKSGGSFRCVTLPLRRSPMQ